MKLFNKFLSCFSVIFIVLLLVSCDSSITGNEGGTAGVVTGNSTTTYTPNTSSREDITSATYDAMPAFAEIITVSLSDASTTCSGSKCTVTTASDLITVTYNGSNNVQFNISGTLDSHGLLINYGEEGKKEKAVGLNLSGVSITSVNTPCIYTNVKKTQPLYISLSGTNTLTDGRTYGIGYSEKEGTDFYTSSFSGTKDKDAELTATWKQGDSSKGTVYSKGPIIISGSGSLTINEGYKHGIASKDYIKVNSGTITVNSTGRNGFHAVNGFIMNDGNITINGTGSHTNNESRGIVVEGSEDNQGEGFIVINGGTLNITTVSKAITAKWDIDDDSDTTVTTDDPYPYVKITGGTIDIETTGTPTENRYGYVTDADGVTGTEKEEIKLAPEGIEGKQAVFISGGTITLNCTDDCINSSRTGSSTIEISGGSIYACSSKNDAIDSNGSLTISGGTVVAIGMTTPECAFDSDNYTFAITGGFVAGIGTSNYSEPTTSACSQGVLVLASSYLGSAGKTIAVKDSSGNVKYAFTLPSGISLQNAVGIFSCPDLSSSETYSLVTGASATSGSNFHGLYTSMPSVSGGKSYSGISFAKNVFTAGSTGNQGAKEGDHGQGMGQGGGQGGKP